MPVKSRIPQLMDALRAIDRKGKEVMKVKAQEASLLLLGEMIRRTPQGRIEPNYTIQKRDTTLTISHGRPSLRQHGMTLKSGWVDPQLETTKRGVSFKLISNAPHMPIILDGSPPHPIPKTGSAIQSFYWFKSPLRFKAAIYSSISHPGFPGSSFAADSIAAKQPQVLSKFREGAMEAFGAVNRFFAKRS